MVQAMCAEKHCAPILIRLAWHDSGTYMHEGGSPKPWPECGGANGSIRFVPEIGHGANAGLNNALALLEPVKQACPAVGWADLMQLASATAVEASGGPKIAMRYGRRDAEGPEACPAEGNLPDARPGPDGTFPKAPRHDAAATPQGHLRAVFHRMGLNDEEIVALSGAHSLGRVHAHRSGAGDKKETPYTVDGPGATKGGQSWTKDWLRFSNDYYVNLVAHKKDKSAFDDNLLVLPTDAALYEDEAFAPFVDKWAADEAAFFAAYAAAHKKLSELGSEFPDGEVSL